MLKWPSMYLLTASNLYLLTALIVLEQASKLRIAPVLFLILFHLKGMFLPLDLLLVPS